MPLEDVSVIIVSYNTRDELRRCLLSIPAGCVVGVVDNASTDGTHQMLRAEFPRVPLLQSHVNRGLGRAANLLLAECVSPYALLLNPDIEVQPGAIERLDAFMDEHPEAVACGGKLLFDDGRLQPSCSGPLTLWAVLCEQSGLEKLFPRSRLFGSYWMGWWDHNVTRPVEQVMGACLMLRRGPDGELPRFDERFFLYCEDTELCHRLVHGTPHHPTLPFEGGRVDRASPIICYVHDAIFTHTLGASGKSDRAGMVSLYNRGKELYFRIHRGRWAAFVCRMLNLKGAALRVPIGLVSREKGRIFARVLWDCLRLPVGFQSPPTP